MKCEVCNNEFNPVPLAEVDHAHDPSPMTNSLCLSCWMFGIQMELFLVRATGHTPMGDWTAGWAKAIIESPKRYLVRHPPAGGSVVPKS